MKSIHHNANSSNHWLSIVFVGFFILMSWDALESAFDNTTDLNARVDNTNAEIERQSDESYQPDSQLKLAVTSQNMNTGGRFAAAQAQEEREASLMDKVSNTAETAYYQVLRANRRLFRLLSRAVHRISADIDIPHIWSRK
jgi:hypothetical protein